MRTGITFILAGLVATLLASSVRAQASGDQLSDHAAVPAGFAPDFQGQVVYTGTFHIKRIFAAKAPSGSLRSNGRNVTFNVNNLFDRPKIDEFGGQIQIVAVFDGQKIQTTRTINGASNTSVGFRNGNNCVLRSNDGEYRAHCGPDGFVGTFSSFQGLNPMIEGTVQASTTKITTKAELDRRNSVPNKASVPVASDIDP